MNATIALVVAAVVLLIVLLELAAAALPLIIIVTLVPPHERAQLAELLASVDSSRRLRLWPALRAAVAARRQCAGCPRAVQHGEVLGREAPGVWPTNRAHRVAGGTSVAEVEPSRLDLARREWS
nr:hypothetical protein [uncultured Actinoplanes sp.]